MKKLLHERLREIKNSDCESLAAVAGVKCHAFCNRYACHKEIYKALADEIEKYYIPRPRFEDGEPVQFGDRFVNFRGEENSTISSLTYTKGFDYQSECHCSKTNHRPIEQRARFDYQSECHCSKTMTQTYTNGTEFDYQSECHCSKTERNGNVACAMFDYQSECHCSKTRILVLPQSSKFDYQSECHCSKTGYWIPYGYDCLTTSQNATAPKPLEQNLPCVEDELSGR